MTDPAGATSETSVTVTANPVAVITPSAVVSPEGQILEFDASASSPVARDAQRTYQWTVTNGQGLLVATSAQPILRFRPPDHGTYAIALGITDTLTSTSVTGFTSSQVAISNVAPQVVLSNRNRTDEGIYVLDVNVLEPGSSDQVQLSIDWGDGTGLQQVDLGTARKAAIEHEFLEQNDYLIVVIASDGQESSQPVELQLEVVNAAPIPDLGGKITVADGELVTVTGSFQDLGSDTHSIIWDFGDGSDPVTRTATGGTPFEETHTYANSGVYLVTLTVVDDEGGVGQATLQVEVVNQAPANLSVTELGAASAGQLTSFAGTVSDFGSDYLRGTLNFGDGTKTPIVLKPRTPVNGTEGEGDSQQEYEFAARHVYASGGMIPVTLTVIDQDGSTSSTQMMLSVADVIVPTITGLQLAEDTGASRNDRVTADATPSFVLNFSEVVNGQATDIEVRNPAGQLVSPVIVSGLGTRTVTVRPANALTTDGNYTVNLRAAGIQDTAGNPLDGGQNQSRTFTLDTTAPQVSFDQSTTGQLSPELVGSIDDPAARIEVTLDGQIYVATNRGDGSWSLPAGLINPPLARITYVVSVSAIDIAGNVATDTGTLTVTPAPLAGDDEFTIAEDSLAVVLDVLANDGAQSPAVGPLRVLSASNPAQGGIVTVAQDGSHVTYTPAGNFFGDAAFVYTLRDASGGTSQANVVVHVEDRNDDPTALSDRFLVNIDSSDNVLGLLLNDSAAPDGPELLTIVSTGVPNQGGQVQLTPDGRSLRYTPATGFTGQETFSYTIEDDRGGAATTNVTIDVADGPTALTLVAKSDGQRDDLVIRRSGIDLEVFDNVASQTIARRRLSLVQSVQFLGAENEDDALTIDFAQGGFFSIPGGIQALGGASGQDVLRIVGAA